MILIKPISDSSSNSNVENSSILSCRLSSITVPILTVGFTGPVCFLINVFVLPPFIEEWIGICKTVFFFGGHL